MFQLIPINTEVYSIPAKLPPFHEDNFMISIICNTGGGS